MPGADDKFLQRLLATFQAEARDHIQAVASGLVQLEKAPLQDERAAILDAVFRAAHSLKGAARTVNFTEVEHVCQSLENVFAAFKRGQLVPSAILFDHLHQALTTLGHLLQLKEPGSPGSPTPPVAELLASLNGALTPNAVPEQGTTEVTAPLAPPTPTLEAQPTGQRDKWVQAETIRVSTAKLDTVLLQAEELVSAKLAASRRAVGLRRLQSRPSEWKKKWAKLRDKVRTLEQSLESQPNGDGQSPVSSGLRPIVEFLEWNQEFIESLHTGLADLAGAASQDQRSLAAMVDNLLDEMKKVVMLPFSTVLDVFPRFVRELSREQGKQVELVINGGEIEVDRRILEEMKDPLVHLVRNCLDHGVETPAARTQQGKPARGTITLALAPTNASQVQLLIADDGAGIDAHKVKAAAVKSGLLPPETADTLSEEEALSFIFQSGISTSPIITDISGRGLGLAIVKEKVERLNGTLLVETEPGKGTAFRMILPLTVSRFRGVIVRVDEQHFVIPTSQVDRVARLKKEQIKTVENRETIVLGGQTLSLVRLGRALALPPKTAPAQPPETLLAIVLACAGQRIAFLVDDILEEQEVLVKTMGKQLVRVRNFAGATILASGQVVPILSVVDLMKSAVRASAARVESAVAPAATIQTKRKSVLVAEDSITSRTLLKNIIETAGYKVETAVDGTDAFTRLRSGQFDLVVSDVDMPRMNGFGLTAKIRADKMLAELPVILVTALESSAHREQGIDAGANAYIVKSSFDQSNLLEVVRRLI